MQGHSWGRGMILEDLEGWVVGTALVLHGLQEDISFVAQNCQSGQGEG